MLQTKPVDRPWLLITFLFIYQPFIHLKVVFSSPLSFFKSSLRKPTTFSPTSWTRPSRAILCLPSFSPLPQLCWILISLCSLFPKHRPCVSCCSCLAVGPLKLMLLWDTLCARAAHILLTILALTFLQKSDYLPCRCILRICKSKAGLKLCKAKEVFFPGDQCLWKGLFLLRDLSQIQTKGGWRLLTNADSKCKWADVSEVIGRTKAAFPVRDGWFAEEVGFGAKRARAEEPRGWFLVVFFQRRCWFNTSCCSVLQWDSPVPRAREFTVLSPCLMVCSAMAACALPCQQTWEMLGAAACQSGWKTLLNS